MSCAENAVQRIRFYCDDDSADLWKSCFLNRDANVKLCGRCYLCENVY